MTDAEKLAAINQLLTDLDALMLYMARKGHQDQVEQAKAHSLQKIAEVVGFSFAQ